MAMILSVDRQDYTKGIPNDLKLLAAFSPKPGIPKKSAKYDRCSSRTDVDIYEQLRKRLKN